MQISPNENKGNSIENAIILNAQDTISGLTLEHEYIDMMLATLEGDVESIEQDLIIIDGRQFDQVTVTMIDGSEMELYFDLSSFFGKI